MKNNDKHPTYTADLDIVNGVKDEYGCIYSHDGKRLIRGADNIEYYTIKEGTEVVCDYAFSFYDGCAIQNIVVPNSVTAIGNWAFNRCKKLQSISLPESVVVIYSWAFAGCESLEDVVLPYSLIAIGDNAFDGCASLQNIVLPGALKRIGNETFDGCYMLQTMVLPKSIIAVGRSPFPEGIEIISESERLVVDDDLLVDLERRALIQCVSDKKDIVVPNVVNTIIHGAFKGCDFLESVVLPPSVAAIDNGVFDDCVSLQYVVVHGTTTTIHKHALGSCPLLHTLYIPKGSMAHYQSVLDKCLHSLLKEVEEL